MKRLLNRPLLGTAAAVGLLCTLPSSAGPAEAQGSFQDYVQTVPGTEVEFKMIAVRGGEYERGAPDAEAESHPDAVARHRVRVGDFWIGAAEVTWDEYELFFFGGAPEGIPAEIRERVDAVSRPTPPYIAPDLGWGAGSRPAMGMTHEAARRYTEWLSAMTGRNYRLPTEAEWEYACRAGSSRAAPQPLEEYAWFRDNSGNQSHEAASLNANAWGLFDMLGNVAEFTLDYYDPDHYSAFPPNGWPPDPGGPESGRDYVLRGGSYMDPAEQVNCFVRTPTDESYCRMTDPQEPKSIWWYSDCYHIGFRVVRERE